jgi:putative phage-type endonuclease
MRIYESVVQGSDEWKYLRLGKFTASTIPDLFSKPTTATYQNAINKVVFEKITGELPESFSNEWMQRGVELEPEAREIYEITTFNKVEVVGFVEKSEWLGCSPDGLIGKDGMVQIKCPKYSTIVSYYLDKKIPKDYEIQMQAEMWVADRKWSDFMAYHPKLKPLIIRTKRNTDLINEISAKVEEAIQEVDKRIKIIGG